MKIAEFRAIADRACCIIGLWSPAAVQLVTMTACHESRLKFRHQLGNGPALGLCQMEPATAQDIWNHFLSPQWATLGAKVELTLASGQDSNPKTMADNDLYAAAMCRVHYFRVKEPLPDLGDPDGLAAYWKRHYNTPAGAGTPEQFKSSYIALSIEEAWSPTS
jgi:hypothetical protein